MSRYILVLLGLFLISSCTEKLEVDTILNGAMVYSNAKANFTQYSIAISDGKIAAVGPGDSINKHFSAAQQQELEGKFIYPGFNDAHAHFHGYSLLQLQVDLRGTASYEDVLERTSFFAEVSGLEYIEGRGWDQNDWEVKEFPSKAELDRIFPDKPVLLKRVDGHAAIANQAALDYAGITTETIVVGGLILQEEGALTGLLIDNAVDLVILPKPDKSELRKAVLWAQDSMFRYGITSVTDAGIKSEDIDLFQEMESAGDLKLRVNAMIADYPEEWDRFLEAGPFKGDRLQAICFKIYMDGAMGSRGALLLEPYADDPGNYGLLLHDTAHFKEAAEKLKQYGWQMAVHAIGDSANRYVLDLFENALGDRSEEYRWRVEHAQIVHEHDRDRFGELGVIASVQPTHATSDMYWIEERLGAERMQEAYIYKDLLESAGMLPFGTDFPVEDIDPFKTIRAAVFRQDTAGFPPGGFGEGQQIGRGQVMRAMTEWPAYASFEEEVKGAIKVGMYADLAVLGVDLLKVNREELEEVAVFQTWVNGELVYQR